MQHWIILPIILPALVGAALVAFARGNLGMQRAVSGLSVAALAVIGTVLLVQAGDDTYRVYALGDWPAPFGIVLVLDRLSALMVLLVSVLGAAAWLLACRGWDAQGRHFHALFQFQVMGVNGAFLTGDLFNLFVFFEVLLIASYGLMLHGGGGRRLKAGLQYVLINLTGSSLFLIAVALIYGVTGTLNMADLNTAVAQVAPEDEALLRVGGALLLLVFAVKAALVPVHLWLPATYAEAPAPVAALFAIMTKVGAYAIIRVYTLIFGVEGGPVALLAQPWLLPAACVTMALGMVGVLAARRLGPLVGFSIVGSMGTVLIPVGLFTADAMTAAIYYMIHSTLAGALLFLTIGLVAERRGPNGDGIAAAAPFPRAGLLAAAFFAGGIAMAGLPPFSGFIGKVLILNAAIGGAAQPWIWSVVLGASLICVIGFARAGSLVFWRSTEVGAPSGGAATGAPVTRGERGEDRVSALSTVSVLVPLGGLVAITLGAGPVTGFAEAVSAQLFAPSGYVQAVIGVESLGVQAEVVPGSGSGSDSTSGAGEGGSAGTRGVGTPGDGTPGADAAGAPHAPAGG